MITEPDDLLTSAKEVQSVAARTNVERISAASIGITCLHFFVDLDTTKFYFSAYRSSDSDYEPPSTVTTASSLLKLNSETRRDLLILRRNVTREMVLEDTKLFLGVPADHTYLIDHLADTITTCEEKLAPRKKNKIALSAKDRVLITLRKVRLNESFTLIACFFGIAKSTVSRVFRTTLPTLATCMAEMIIRVPPEQTLLNLPIAFRYQYHKVTDILDCFEVGVQASSDSANRAVCYSSYKGGTTLKFLVCITPDCYCTYMSRGYGGRISDTSLTKDCGYMELLTEKHAVMADRGFKGLAAVLDLMGVELMRPPSISKGQPMTEGDCILTTKVASLRIHVERFINKLRYFQFVAPHASIPVTLIPYVEMGAIIAAALVNVGNPLIREE
jgi:hypothetical protein